MKLSLIFAVDRLYETGWLATDDIDCDRLPDGRRFPTVLGVQREFARAGLDLAIKHNLLYNCYRAAWAPVGETPSEAAGTDERRGTVVGRCEREAAVYALAQLRIAQQERQMELV